MGVEVVLDQHDPLGFGVVHVDQCFDAGRPVDAGAAVADADVPPATQRLADQEQVAHPAADIFVVLPSGLPWRDRQRRADVPPQLAAGLVQAHLRAARIVGSGGHLQHLLHVPDELGARLRRDAPLLLQPGLQVVCFKTWRTVSYETAGTTSNATRCASWRPSTVRRDSRSGGLRSSAASSPWVAKR